MEIDCAGKRLSIGDIGRPACFAKDLDGNNDVIVRYPDILTAYPVISADRPLSPTLDAASFVRRDRVETDDDASLLTFIGPFGCSLPVACGDIRLVVPASSQGIREVRR